jgi:hypothetical protein
MSSEQFVLCSVFTVQIGLLHWIVTNHYTLKNRFHSHALFCKWRIVFVNSTGCCDRTRFFTKRQKCSAGPEGLCWTVGSNTSRELVNIMQSPNDSNTMLDSLADGNNATDMDQYIFDRTDIRALFITLYTIVFCCCFFGESSKCSLH